MVYHLSGGNTDYDPSLQGLPSNSFVGIDSEFGKVDVADITPDDGGLIMARTWHEGRPVRVDENMPTKLRRTGPPISRTKLLDVNQQTGALDLVNQAFKDIVEEFEPDIHQFFSMEYYDARGKEKIGEGYWMIICQRLDTLHDTLCIPPRNARGFIDRSNPKYKDRDKSLDRLVFNKQKAAGHHMWHDKFTSGTFFSNEMTKRLIAAELSGLGYQKCEEA